MGRSSAIILVEGPNFATEISFSGRLIIGRGTDGVLSKTRI